MQKNNFFRMNTCRIEARYIQAIEDATFRLERAETSSTGHAKQEQMALAAAQAQWSEHKASYPILQQGTDLLICIPIWAGGIASTQYRAPNMSRVSVSPRQGRS